MLKLNKQQEKAMYDLLKSCGKHDSTKDRDDTLFRLWDFLEEEGFEDYQIQEFITQKGDWVQTRAMLMELTNL